MHTDIAFIRDACNGRLLAQVTPENTPVNELVWDSRKVTHGCAFLALPGERVDGNDFLVAAIEAGAALIITSREPSKGILAIAGEFACAVLLVKDTQQAIIDLAAAYRAQLSATVVGITGSTGKTTTKDLIASVLAGDFATCATQGNHNNELGVPATILAAGQETQALVVEMGMRGLGQLTALCSFVKPVIGVVTNIGVTHMELLGSQENIARAKGEMLAALPGQGGCAILPGDDAFTPFLVNSCVTPGARVLTYGLSSGCDVRAENVLFDAEGLPFFVLVLPDGQRADVHLPLHGKHNVVNALAAAAVGWQLGMQADRIAVGLEQAQITSMRFEVIHAKAGFSVVNDAYNANPDSMRAALETLRVMDVSGRRIAVLGDMGELGVQEVQLHREVGEAAARADIDYLVCIGPLSKHIAQAALDAGFSAQRILSAFSSNEALEKLKELVKPGDAVLVKASRFMELETIVKGLVD